jgi:CRP-like cAMP-binding protein
MALQRDMDVLASAPLFNLLDGPALRLLAFAAETRLLREDEILFRKGERSDGGYVVMDGAVALDVGDGSPVFLAETGAVIGRTALFVRTSRPATATATAPSAVMRVSQRLMRRVLEEFPSAAAALRQAQAAELADLADGLERVRERFQALGAAENVLQRTSQPTS